MPNHVNPVEAAKILREKQNSALLQRQGFNPSTKTLTRPQANTKDDDHAA